MAGHEDDLFAALRTALGEWLRTIRDAIVDRDNQRVDPSRMPNPNMWARLLRQHVAPILTRLWRAAYDAAQKRLSGSSDEPGEATEQQAQDATDRLIDGLSDGTPNTVATIIRSDLDKITGRVTAGNVVGRIRALLDVDAPDTRMRDRATALEAIIDDPESTPEQRRRARADLTELQSGIRVEDHQWTSLLRRLTHDAIHAANNSADLEGARTWMDASGETLLKRWLHTRDGRTRDTHVAAGGQTVALAEPFRVGAAMLMYPGDPTGPPGEWMRCRCTVEYVTPEEAQGES